MKQTILLFIGISSLFLILTTAYNFDDHERALQRSRDMMDTSPMSPEEVNRLRSLLDKGRLQIVQRQSLELLVAGNEKNSIVRTLRENAEHNTNHITNRASRNRDQTSRARGNVPKKEKRNSPRTRDEAKKRKRDGLTDGKRTKRHAPTDGKRSRERPGHHTKRVSGGTRTASRPESTVRNQPTEADRHYEGHDTYDDAVAYDDYYYQEGDDYYYNDGDDYYYTQSGGEEYSGGHGSINDKDNSASGGAGGGGLTYVFMILEGLQDGRRIGPPIPPNPARPDEFDAGTTYLFNKEPVFGVIFDEFSGNSTSGILVDVSDRFAQVTGKCIRTDPHDQLDMDNYVGLAYCQFVYVFDGSENDSLTAEGPIEMGEDAVLAVTGGSGVYRRTVGQIFLTPVEPDPLNSSPPSIEFSYELDLPSSYYMQALLYMDESLIPPELLE